jgi:8-oxo-dGTP diphosphatase
MSDLKRYTDYQTILSVNALIWAEGKVLLLKRAANKKVDPGVYSGVGGKVEPGEDFYSAILREIKEETGIENFRSIRCYSITQHPYPPSNAEWVNIYFNIEIEKIIEISNSDDGDFHWIDPDKIEGLPMVSDLKKYIKILAKNPNAFIFGFFEYDQSGKPRGEKITVM